MSELWEMVVGAICGGFILMILFSICRCCLGFTSSGVRSGSHAAEYHSMIGDVESGSLFSWCQSGVSCCANLFLFAAGAGIAVGLIYLYDWVFAMGNDPRNSTVHPLYRVG